MNEEQERLWTAFLAGFKESGEGLNGEMMWGNQDAYLRHLRARFEELHDSGEFDEPYERTADTPD